MAIKSTKQHATPGCVASAFAYGLACSHASTMGYRASNLSEVGHISSSLTSGG